MGRVSNGGGNRRFALGAIAGVLVGGLLILGALTLVHPRGASTAVPTRSASVTQSAGGSPSAGPTQPSETVTASASPSASATPEGGLATPASGTWFALVRWMDKGSFTQTQAIAYAAKWTAEGHPVAVIDTDVVKLRSGKAGQWAIGVIGLESMNDATAACRAMGLVAGPQCGRYEIS